jgi:superfamily II DNA or RNA helicase
MFVENPDQQIMVIAHNRSILTYIHDAIEEQKFATVGYYVGGMKETALKKTEDKQVVIATYAMAAEGLDIKTLCTIVMVTPKTDIEQSVGRILRSDHEMPIVVDIVDSHEPFQKQWVKRRAFFKKENYRIIKTNSSNYDPDTNGWEVVYEPKVKKDATAKKENESEEEDDEPKPERKCNIDLSLFE